MSQVDDSAISDPKTGTILTGLVVLAAAGVSVWAQTDASFAWDADVAEWVRKTIPGLKGLEKLVHWPITQKWPFASLVMLVTIVLCVVHKRKGAVFLLSSVAGALLLDWALNDLDLPRDPVMPTLFYGTFFGGLALGLHPFVAGPTRGWLWGLTAVVCFLSGLGAIATGADPSAWFFSALVAAAWILLLDQITR